MNRRDLENRGAAAISVLRSSEKMTAPIFRGYPLTERKESTRETPYHIFRSTHIVRSKKIKKIKKRQKDQKKIKKDQRSERSKEKKRKEKERNSLPFDI